ncbi:MAG TPA: hypothetical protein DEA08_24425 [Planctomycetes bacterium]|nr:hypothetical protein [Planctomycetota bacterium]
MTKSLGVVMGVAVTLAMGSPCLAELPREEWKAAKRELDEARKKGYGFGSAIKAVAVDDSKRAVRAIAGALMRTPDLSRDYERAVKAVAAIREPAARAELLQQAGRGKLGVRYLFCDALLRGEPSQEFVEELLRDGEPGLASLAAQALSRSRAAWAGAALSKRLEELKESKKRALVRQRRSLQDALAQRQRAAAKPTEKDPRRTRTRAPVVFHSDDRELLTQRLSADEILVLNDPEYGDEEGARLLEGFLDEHGVRYSVISDPSQLPQDGVLIGNFSAKFSFSGERSPLVQFVRRGGFVMTAGQSWAPFGIEFRRSGMVSSARDGVLIPGPKAKDHFLLEDVFPANPLLRVRWEQALVEGYTVGEGVSLVEVDPAAPGRPSPGSTFARLRPRKVRGVIANFVTRGRGAVIVLEPSIKPQRLAHDEAALKQLVLNFILAKARQRAGKK